MKLGDQVIVLEGSNHPKTTGQISFIGEIGPYYKSNLMSDNEICLTFDPNLIYKQTDVELCNPDEFEKAVRKWQKYFNVLSN